MAGGKEHWVVNWVEVLAQAVPPGVPGLPPVGVPVGPPVALPPTGSSEFPLVVYTVLFLAAVAVAVTYWLYVRGRRLEMAWRRAVRERRVELLAEEAVFDDPAFAPEAVKGAAIFLHAEVVAAWTAADDARLAELLGRKLLAEWRCRLRELNKKGWSNRLQRRGRPRVRYVGLINRPGDADDRAVVHVRARMRDRLYDSAGRVVFRDGNDKGRRTMSEYWTMAKRDGRWILVSVETDWEGAHHLRSPIVPSPWADDRLEHIATLERASGATIPPAALAAAVPAELADDLRLAALDLAGFDGRYAPDVLEASARRTVAAWADAIDGDDRPLVHMAGGGNTTRLLHPDRNRRHRLVIRGPRLRQLRITALRPKATPPAMTIEATITARRYIEHRANNAVLVGSRDHDSTFTVRCDLELSDHPRVPWRIVRIHHDHPTTRLWTRLTHELPVEIFDLMSDVTGRRH